LCSTDAIAENGREGSHESHDHNHY